MDDFRGGASGETNYAIFNPASNSVVGGLQTVNIGHDMFCPGISMLPNGDVLVVGGSAGGDGAGSSSVWTGSSFVPAADLNIARGYNSAVTLANGNVCVSLYLYA